MADTRMRQAQRTPVTLKIKFKSETLDQFIERYAVDVSHGGIFIRTKDPLPVGTMMRFEFQLKDASLLIRGEGTVVWTREHDPARAGVAPGMGVRFDRLSDSSQAVLDKILAQKNAKASGPSAAATFSDQPTKVVTPSPLVAGVGPSSRVGARGPGFDPSGSFVGEQTGSDITPLPSPVPFHSDVDEFPEEAFQEATKVASMDDLVARSAQAEAVPQRADRSSDDTLRNQAPRADEQNDGPTAPLPWHVAAELAASREPDAAASEAGSGSNQHRDELAERRRTGGERGAPDWAESHRQRESPTPRRVDLPLKATAPGTQPPSSQAVPLEEAAEPSARPRGQGAPGPRAQGEAARDDEVLKAQQRVARFVALESAKISSRLRGKAGFADLEATELTHGKGDRGGNYATTIVLVAALLLVVGAGGYYMLAKDEPEPVAAADRVEAAAENVRPSQGASHSAATAGPGLHRVEVFSAEVLTEPSGATVELLETGGKAPAPVRLTGLARHTGHRVRISLAGYVTEERVLEADIPGPYRVTLREKEKRLRIMSTPPGASVYVEGKLERDKRTPLEIPLVGRLEGKSRLKIGLRLKDHERKELFVSGTEGFAEEDELMVQEIWTVLEPRKGLFVNPPAAAPTATGDQRAADKKEESARTPAPSQAATPADTGDAKPWRPRGDRHAQTDEPPVAKKAGKADRAKAESAAGQPSSEPKDEPAAADGETEGAQDTEQEKGGEAGGTKAKDTPSSPTPDWAR